MISPRFDTKFVFTRGRLTIVMDGGAGSSGKGKLGSFICEHADNWQFACDTFMPQAGHWVKLDDGRSYFYQTFNSCAYLNDRYEKLYIGPGATIELPAFYREMEENNIKPGKIGISPLTSILQDIDQGYERGTHDFNGHALRELAAHRGRTQLDHFCSTDMVRGAELHPGLTNLACILRDGYVPGTAVVTINNHAGQTKVAFGSDGTIESKSGAAADQIVSGHINLKLGSLGLQFCGTIMAGQTATVDYEVTRGHQPGGYLAKTGTTAHGCGANRARRVLRRPEARYARDFPELKEFICDVPGEIMARLDGGQSGLLEVAQGFQLSYLLPTFFPFTTSRNATVAAALDDLMVPPYYAGNVILNFRTFPIRINNNKYLDKTTGRHLTWDEVEVIRKSAVATVTRSLFSAGSGHRSEDVEGFLGAVAEEERKHMIVVKGDSGPGYPDQHEITWEELTSDCGSPEPILEMTSVTKLPRRVFTFSEQNLAQAILHNRTYGHTFLSLNFANYVDHSLSGKRAACRVLTPDVTGQKLSDWLGKHGLIDRRLCFIGTGPRTDDMLQVRTDS